MLDRTLSALAAATAAEFETARSMPSSIYASEEIFALEVERLFRGDWIWVGPAAEIPESGDYLTFQIIDHPVLVVRQDDATVSAFSNICAHRAAKVVDGSGNASRFVCPYHAWSYACDGRLICTRFMQDTPGFDPAEHLLQTLRCETWAGFVYVRLKPNVESVADRLEDLRAVIGSFRIANYQHAFTEEERWPANWKCFVDNYMDAYQLFKVHANTFGQSGHYEDLTRLYDGGDHFTYHLVDSREGDEHSMAHPDNHWLEDGLRRTTVLACVFPAHTMQLQPDMLWSVTVQPNGVDHFRMRWSVSVPGEILDGVDDPAAHIAHWREFLSAVNVEDEAVVQRAFVGLKAGADIRGPMSYLERNVYRFGQYLARRLCNAR